jgi:hypothetical protein
MSFKKIIVSSVAAAAVASSVFAGTVTLSDNGKGDYLNYPAYYATTDGWSTNIRVVNTNTTHAVIAKVVIREYATSKELLDFPIYLSPADVWTGDLVNDGSSVKIVSSDDSSPEVPMSQALFNNNTLAGTAYGYVEVLGVVMKPASQICSEETACTSWAEFTPLSKAVIKSNYEKVTTATGATGNVTQNWLQTTQVLFGQEVVTQNTAGSEKSMTLVASAANVVLTAGEDDARNVSTSAVFATDTQADSIFYGTMGDDYRTALLKTGVQFINYTNGGGETQMLLTQAMKHTNDDNSVTDGGMANEDRTTTVGEDQIVPYYETTADEKAGKGKGSDSKFYFVGRTWDESENTYTVPGSIYSGTTTTNAAEQCLTEICYVYYNDFIDAEGPVNTAYASGWVNVTLGTNSQGTTLVGNPLGAVPLIPTIMTGVKVNGVGITNLIPAVHTKAAN